MHPACPGNLHRSFFPASPRSAQPLVPTFHLRLSAAAHFGLHCGAQKVFNHAFRA